VLPASAGRRPLPGQPPSAALAAQLAGRSTTNTTDVELTITARVGPQGRPLQLIADINRGGNTASVTLKQW
jgi:hypothetical protein